MQLKSVFLICRDVAATLAFYRDELGLEALSSSRLRLGPELELHLHPLLSAEDRLRYALGEPGEGPREGVVLSLRVGDLQPYLELPRRRCGPLEAPWGDRLLIVEDPEGNLVELAQPSHR